VLLASGASGAGLALSGVPLVLLSLGFLARPVPAGPLWLVPAAVLVVLLIVFPAMELPTRKILR
jgi:putative ABC transport system permease protein